jgi:hypothetical protein
LRDFLCLFLAFTALAAAQPKPVSIPRIGILDFYGRNRVSEDVLRKTLGFREGDPLPRSKGDVEEALEQVKGVVSARMEAACCEDGKAILYVGIEETGAPHFDYNATPVGEARISEEIHAEYGAFLAAVQKAIRNGPVNEHLAEGHSLMEDPEAYAHQKRFVELARDNLQALREVLRESANEEHRAIAAYVIGYAPKKKDVVNDLQSALRDQDDTVRNNAMRALGAIAVLAAKDPAQQIQVSPTWFIEALDSLVWQDKTTAAITLVTLTESRPPRVLEHLKERAVPTLAVMARWKHLPHALPAFILLGRMHGVPEEEIQKAWSEGRRDTFLAGLLKPVVPVKKK